MPYTPKTAAPRAAGPAAESPRPSAPITAASVKKKIFAKRLGSLCLSLDGSGTMRESEPQLRAFSPAVQAYLARVNDRALHLVHGAIGVMTGAADEVEAPDFTYSEFAPWADLAVPPEALFGGWSPLWVHLAGFARRHAGWVEREIVQASRELVVNKWVVINDFFVSGIPAGAEAPAKDAWSNYVRDYNAELVLVAGPGDYDERVAREVFEGSRGEFKVHRIGDVLEGGGDFMGLVIDQIIAVSNQASGDRPRPRPAITEGDLPKPQ